MYLDSALKKKDPGLRWAYNYNLGKEISCDNTTGVWTRLAANQKRFAYVAVDPTTQVKGEKTFLMDEQEMREVLKARKATISDAVLNELVFLRGSVIHDPKYCFAKNFKDYSAKGTDSKHTKSFDLKKLRKKNKN